MIVKGDIVYHQLSGLLFRCENSKHEKWMNLNRFYIRTHLKEINYDQWEKTQKGTQCAKTNLPK